MMYEIDAIPDGLTLIRFEGIILVEFILLVSVSILMLIALRNYIIKKTIERLFVNLFLLINFIMFLQMVVSKLMILKDLLAPDDPMVENFSFICFSFANIIAFLIYSGVFILNPKTMKRSRIIYTVLSLIPLILYLLIENMFMQGLYIGSYFTLSIIVYGGFMLSSMKFKKTLKDPFSKITMDLLFFTGFSINLTLLMSVVNQILKFQGIIISILDGLYLFYITLGLFPTFLIYLAFFQPLWFKKVIMKKKERKSKEIK